MTKPGTDEARALDRAEAFAKSANTTLDEHNDIMVAVRMARAFANEQASAQAIPAGMKAWAGGDGPPVDWDGGDVLHYDGNIGSALQVQWKHGWSYNNWRTVDGDIIAYTPKASAQGVGEVERAAWDWIDAKFLNVGAGHDPNDRDYGTDDLIDAFVAGRASTPEGRVSDEVAKLADEAAMRMWSVHPKDLDAKGFVSNRHGGTYENPRAAYYASEILSVVRAALNPTKGDAK